MAAQRTFDQKTAWVVAFVIFAVAFGILRFGAGYSAGAALIVALLLGLLAGVVGWIAFSGKRGDEGAADTTSAQPEDSMAPPAGTAKQAPPANAPATEDEPKSHRASLMMGEAGHALRQEMARRVGAPAALSDPRNGQADDLTEIKGVGPKLQEMLNDLGIYHFDQIAAWSDEERQWVDENLRGFRGRASRDDWIGQARALADGGVRGGQP